MKDLKIFKSKWIYALALMLVSAVVMMLCPPVFYLNDDTVMRSILNGSYTGTPDGHAVYMQYPLTAILALGYRVFPQVPWMEVFFTICIWGCICLLAYEFHNKVCGMLAAASLLMPFYLYMHYTIVSAIVAATAVFLLCRRKNRLPVLLLWIAYMIRSQVGLLSLPFAAAALLWYALQHREQVRVELVGIVKTVVPLLIGFGLITGINQLCYSSDEWQEYFAYNESRTELYDYTNFLTAEKYMENHQAYGMSRDEAWILRKYYTMLDSNINSSKMQEIAAIVTDGMWEEMNTADVIKECFGKYFYQIRHEHTPYNLLWMLAYIVLAVGALTCKKWLELGFLGVLGLGRSAVWMFLLWKDRFPERVALSLYVMELLLLAAVGVSIVKSLVERLPWKQPWLQKCAMVLLIVCCLVFGAYQCKEAYRNATAYNKAQEDWIELKAYCEANSEITYLLDVFSIGIYMEMGQTPQQPNMFLIGGWLTESPLAHTRIEQMGGEDIAEVLCYNDNVRLLADVSQDMSWLQEYLQNRFGDCELVVTNKIISGWRAIMEYEVQ